MVPDALTLIPKRRMQFSSHYYLKGKRLQPFDSSRALFAERRQKWFMFYTLSTPGNKVGMIRHERKSPEALVLMACVDQMDTLVFWWFLRKLLKSSVRGWMLDMMLQPRCDSIKALVDGRNCLLTKWQRGWWVFLEPLFSVCQLLFFCDILVSSSSE